jgi:hypothetical protein
MAAGMQMRGHGLKIDWLFYLPPGEFPSVAA